LASKAGSESALLLEASAANAALVEGGKGGVILLALSAKSASDRQVWKAADGEEDACAGEDPADEAAGEASKSSGSSKPEDKISINDSLGTFLPNILCIDVLLKTLTLCGCQVIGFHVTLLPKTILAGDRPKASLREHCQ